MIDQGEKGNMQNDLLTVIVLTYNHKGFIAKAIDSILEQKTDFSFIICVADDCSTDGTQEILLKYKRKHPEKIDLHFNKVNLGAAQNGYNALLNIKTKYFALLDGDDQWCDRNKLQFQVNALEKNPDCSICGHNTLIHDVGTGKDKPFIGSIIKYKKIKEKYSVDEPFRVHTSSRVCRNIIAFKDVPTIMSYDTAMYLLYLSKGNLYYIDKVMSIYNIHPQGIWSGADKINQKILSFTVTYNKNKFLNFKYDKMLSPSSKWLSVLKMLLGKRIGWLIYFHATISMLKLRKYLLKPFVGKGSK